MNYKYLLKNYRREVVAAGVVLAFAIIGLILINLGRAATSSVALEAEAGTLSGNTSAGTAAGASGNAAVKFGGGGGNPNPNPNPGVNGELKVSADGRYLTYQDGTPFFWLGDTAWGIFGRLSRADITHYLSKRKEQGFTVIQMVTIFPVYGRTNSEGVNIGNLASPNAQYFELVDFAIAEAKRLGMYTALWPVWSKDQSSVITSGNAQAYGEFLGNRYKNEPLIYVFGGDDADERGDVWRNLAKGIAIGKNGSENYGNTLMSYHPGGQRTSVGFHNEPWLDFNMTQTGHDTSQKKTYEMIPDVYNKTPTKPVVESEAMYEKHSDGWSNANDIASSLEVRSYIYWSILSGGFGHSYGHWYIWPFVDSSNIHPYSSIAKLRGDWKADYLEDEVAGQVKHMKELMLSRNWTSGVPDNSFIGNAGSGLSHIQTLRGKDNSYMIAYTPGNAIQANTSKLSGTAVKGWWYDPRTGTATAIANVAKGASVSLDPPADGDWVLVLDDASKNYPAPGS
jgi:hypothetical protein